MLSFKGSQERGGLLECAQLKLGDYKIAEGGDYVHVAKYYSKNFGVANLCKVEIEDTTPEEA